LCGAEKQLQQRPCVPGQTASSHQDVPGGTQGRFASPLWSVGHQPGEGEPWLAAAGLQAGGICSEPLASALHLPRLKGHGTGSTLRALQEARVPVSLCLGGKRCQVPKAFAFGSVLRAQSSELCFAYSGNRQFVKTCCWANPPSAPGAETSWDLAALSLLPLQFAEIVSVSATSSLRVLTYTQSRAAAFCRQQPGPHRHIVLPCQHGDLPGRCAGCANKVLCAAPSPGGDASLGGEIILALSWLWSRCYALETLLGKGALSTARFAVALVHELVHQGSNTVSSKKRYLPLPAQKTSCSAWSF